MNEKDNPRSKRDDSSWNSKLAQFLARRRLRAKYSFHPDIERFAGMIPKDVEVRKEYYEHIEEKHK